MTAAGDTPEGRRAAARDRAPPRPRLAQALLTALAALAPACTITLSNDESSFGGNGDQYFTSGLRGHLDLPDATGAANGGPSDGWFDTAAGSVADLMGVFDPLFPNADPALTTVAVVAGHELYTPSDLKTAAPLPNDHPYAGWVYVGVVRYDSRFDADATRRDDTETKVEFDLGLVGPSARGEQLQEWAHELGKLQDPQGWDNQLGSEVAFVLELDRRWRHAYGPLGDGGLEGDAIVRAGGAVGTLRTHAFVGEVLRAGWNLPRSFAVESGDRRLAGRSRALAPRSFYAFFGIEGRAVFRNLFLDGNTFRDSQDVPREPLVGALQLGFVYDAGSWRFGWTVTQRTREFEDQDEAQRFGAFTLTLGGR